jgi:hypothetical protein
MPTSRQYQLYEPIGRDIIVSTAPTFRESERLQHTWDAEETGELVTPFDPMLPEWDNDIPEERGETDQSREGIQTSPNLISTTPPPVASSASGGMRVGDRFEQTVLEVPPAQNESADQSNQPELSEFEVDDTANPGDHYERSTPDETVDPGDPLRASPDKIEPQEATDTDTGDTIEVVDINDEVGDEVDDTASDAVDDVVDNAVDNAADLGIRRGNRVRMPTTLYPATQYARLAAEGVNIPRSYEAAVADPHHRANWEAAIKVELDKL